MERDNRVKKTWVVGDSITNAVQLLSIHKEALKLDAPMLFLPQHGKEVYNSQKVSNANCLCQINNVQHPNNKINEISNSWNC